MFDLKKYDFVHAEAGVADPSALSQADRERLLYAGVDFTNEAPAGRSCT